MSHLVCRYFTELIVFITTEEIHNGHRCLSANQNGYILTIPKCLCLYVCLSLSTSVCLFVRLSASPSVFLSLRPSLYLSVRLSAYLSVCLPLCSSFSLFVRLSVCLSVFLNACLSILVSACFFLPVCPLVRLSVCLRRMVFHRPNGILSLCVSSIVSRRLKDYISDTIPSLSPNT